MAIKLSGLHSGMDTESIISELVKAKSIKKTELEGNQKRLSWKQEAWKTLNSKIYSFYSKTLSNMRFQSDYNKKTTTSSSSAVSVVTGSDAPTCVQTMKINSMAKAGYLTGGKLADESGTYTADSKVVEELGIAAGSSFTISANGESAEIKITESTTIGNIITQMREAGVNANFDEINQRFYISAKSTGKDNDFTITSNDANGLDAMSKLGILSSLNDDKNTKALYESYANKLVYNNGVLDRDASVANLKSLIDEAVKKNIEDNNYAKVIEDATKAKEELETKLTTKQEEFQTTYNVADGGYLLTDSVGEDGSTVKVAETDVDKIKEAIEGLNFTEKTTEEYDALSDDEKAAYDAAKAKYDKYNAQLKAAEELKGIQDDIKEQDDIITNAKEYYTPGTDGAEGVATQKLIDAMTQDVLDTATEYKAMLETYAAGASTNAIRIAGEDASITLNGATYTAERNTFEINDLTITINNKTSEEITLSTQEDTEGIYDMVKNFFKEYNELINEMDKLYNAESASEYSMLTDEEKETLSEDEVEEWEKKIKDGLLRRDSTLGTVFDSLKTIMLSGVTMSDGSTVYLNEFGINTLGYFNAEEFQKNAYHIDGDKDDSNTMNNADKLKAAIASDPNKVSEFFSKLARTLYDKLDDLMERTDYSSAFTVYNDKSLQEEYDNYTEKIEKQEEKIANFEDRYYDKFTAMEVAMSKLQSEQNAISSLFA